MLWALSFIDTLRYPDQMCNVANDVKIIHDVTEKQFRQKAKLRSKKEILDQADLILRLNWACVNARLKNESAPGNLDKGVVFEKTSFFELVDKLYESRLGQCNNRHMIWSKTIIQNAQFVQC